VFYGIPSQLQPGDSYYLENVNNAQYFLDKPGEWYEDTATNTLYYHARDGQSAAKISAVIPVAIPDAAPLPGMSTTDGGPLMQIGTPLTPLSQQAENLMVSGLTFEYSSWLGPTNYGYVAEQEGVFTRGSSSGPSGSTQVPALAIANAYNTIVQDNTFQHLGGAGIGLICQTVSSDIEGNTMTDISGNAIVVDGVPTMQSLSAIKAYGSSYTSVAEFVSQNDTIQQNTITYAGQEYPDSAGIMVAYCDDMKMGGPPR
jgi:hypothetical protein